MNLLDELTFGKQLLFSEGDIELFGQRLLFYPSDFLALYTLEVVKDVELTCMLYNSIKQNVIEGFGGNVQKMYDSVPNYTKMITEVAEFTGWGKFSESDPSPNAIFSSNIISVEGSPIGTYLKGKVKSPCDHFTRALIAGNAAAAIKSDIDAIEIECVALGSPSCKFILAKRQNLQMQYPDLYRSQIVGKVQK